MARLLVVDDDPGIRQAMRIGLTARGYEVSLARTGEEALSQVALTNPDVVLLDLGLADLDGLEVCRRIRQWSKTPIVVLSAAGAEDIKVAALDGGADDYVTKPFSMAELEARLRVALRHANGNGDQASGQPLTLGNLVVDAVHHEARVNGEVLDLTAREFDLLCYLAQHVGKVCTHHMILSAVWGPGYGDESHYLRVYTHRLRKKLGNDSGVSLRTRPRIGYQLVTE